MDQPAKILVSYKNRRKYEDVMAKPTDTLFRYLPNGEIFSIILNDVRHGPYEKINAVTAINRHGKYWYGVPHNLIVWHVLYADRQPPATYEVRPCTC